MAIVATSIIAALIAAGFLGSEALRAFSAREKLKIQEELTKWQGEMQARGKEAAAQRMREERIANTREALAGQRSEQIKAAGRQEFQLKEAQNQRLMQLLSTFMASQQGNIRAAAGAPQGPMNLNTPLTALLG